MLGLCLSANTLSGCGDVAEAPSLCAPPSEARVEVIERWLSTGCFETWDAESSVMEATQSDGQAQIYINPTLRDSLARQAPSHPVGSAAVRVIYLEDKATRWGHALSLKVDAGEGERWFWFERFENHEAATVASFEASGCTGCHAAGQDFVHSTWPLR